MRSCYLFPLVLWAAGPVNAAQWLPDADFEVSLEYREFLQQPWLDDQPERGVSVYGLGDMAWDTGDSSRLTFKPFYRYDSEDSERTHGDIRELQFQWWGSSWEVRAGIGKVFWGVTESLHLVDVINQTDQVEAVDGEDKLGQPMLHGIWLHDAGTLEAFVLPYFRERTFSSEDGRPSALLPVKSAVYQSSDKENHIDLALRWSRSFEIDGWPLDISADIFSGTSRQPFLLPDITLVDGNPLVSGLRPYYPQVTEAGMTLQHTVGSWLWKLEALHRDYDASAQQVAEDAGNETLQDHQAMVGGFEYTLVGPFGDCCDSPLDLGILMEYQGDLRSEEGGLAQNDLFVGTRWAFNDADSSEVLVGFTQDLDYSGSRSLMVEASTRMTSFSTMSLNLWWFAADNREDEVLYSIRQDDFVELSYTVFF